MDRAYSILEVKAVDDEERVIRGVATTPSVDRVGDIIEPLGVKFRNPLALLHQHDHRNPVGTVKFDRPTADGITFEARLPKVTEAGPLKDRIDTAWGEVKAGLVRAVSIGFRPIEDAYEVMKSGGIRFLKTEVLELSLVTVPANADARISLIKSIDRDLRAATGHEQDGDEPTAAAVTTATPPVASGTRKPVNLRPKEASKMNIAEHIAALEGKRAANTARMEEIAKASADEGRSMDEAEQEEFDDLSGEVESVDKDLKRLRSLEKLKKLTPVENVRSADDGAATRRGGGHESIVVRQPKEAPGVLFARAFRVKALARIDGTTVREMAETLYPGDDRIIKATVPAMSTDHATAAGPLVGVNLAASADFAEYLRAATILGKFGTDGIPSLRRVPFRVGLHSQTSGGAAYWVREGASKPLTSTDFAVTYLEPLKIANIAVCTEELLRDSSPSAELLVRDTIRDAIAAKLDTDFINPNATAVANVSPASITSGVTLPDSSGQNAAAIRADVRTIKQAFISANNKLRTGVWVMSESTAMYLETMVNALGQPEFPTIMQSGGRFFGHPVITSEYVSNYASSPADNTYSYVYLVNAEDIFMADEGGVAVDMSREASLEMVDTGTQSSISPPGVTASQVVSMFQTNSVAFRAERTVNWARRRSSAVAGLKKVAWGQ